MRIERFDGVFGGWYAVVGDRETATYPFRWLARVAGWLMQLRSRHA